MSRLHLKSQLTTIMNSNNDESINNGREITDDDHDSSENDNSSESSVEESQEFFQGDRYSSEVNQDYWTIQKLVKVSQLLILFSF